MGKIVPLFSSSKGNSYYISGNNEAILVDAGRNCKQLELAMMSNEIDTKTIKAIFITHEHTDHISALKVFAKRYALPIYATAGTIQALIQGEKIDKNADLRVIENEVVLGDMRIQRVGTSHDAAESCGYFITTADGRKCSIVTDTGFLREDALNALKNSNCAVIESNHDVKMLQNGPYPYILKKRVLSPTGHLSNEDCSKVLPTLIESGVTHLMLSHLSQENNLPRLALDTAINKLSSFGMVKDSDYTIMTAPPDTTGKKIIF